MMKKNIPAYVVAPIEREPDNVNKNALEELSRIEESSEILINKFEILGLFGWKDVRMLFNDNVLILIGENGYGKTTILKALTYVLSGQYDKLASIVFSEISIEINHKCFSFSHEMLDTYNKLMCENRNHDTMFSFAIRHYISKEEQNIIKQSIETSNVELFNKLAENNDYIGRLRDRVYEYFVSEYSSQKKYAVLNELRETIQATNYDILFLPTYRRVERNFDSFFTILKKHLDEPEMTLLKEELMSKQSWGFGISDVVHRLNEMTENIKQAFQEGYNEVTADMIRALLKTKRQQETIATKSLFNKQQAAIIVNRLGNNISDKEKQTILSQIEKRVPVNKYLSYFLDRLTLVYEKQQEYDNALKRFCDVCNKYLIGKQIVYDESLVTVSMYRTDTMGNLTAETIDFDVLSSGEKQIVSIFAKVYLSVNKKYIILFDEPELSLSIYWQETFLSDIIESNNCAFLLAATHSPFIFDKKLKKNTIGLRTFVESHGR